VPAAADCCGFGCALSRGMRVIFLSHTSVGGTEGKAAGTTGRPLQPSFQENWWDLWNWELKSFFTPSKISGRC